jgi:hypothetical protein
VNLLDQADRLLLADQQDLQTLGVPQIHSLPALRELQMILVFQAILLFQGFQ